MEFQNQQRQPDTPATPRNPRQKRARRERKPSFKYMTLSECADHFCVDEKTVRTGVGIFARLQLVSPTPRRTLVLRSSVEKLDRDLERAALVTDVASIERRKSA
ncbi:MAG: hypothetical protein WCF57_20105 [Pyrinomonadaceae bacterium]